MALSRMRRELSVSLPLLKDRAGALAKDLDDARNALAQEREKLRVLKNKRELQARAQRLAVEKGVLEQHMGQIMAEEKRALDPRSLSDTEIRDCIIQNRIDMITATRDRDIIEQALALAASLRSERRTCACSIDSLHIHKTDSAGTDWKIYSDPLFNAQVLLADALKTSPPSKAKPAAAPEETLARRLDRNATYQDLKARRNALLAQAAETEANLASLQVYMTDWKTLIENDANQEALAQQQASDEATRAPRTALKLGGGAGIVVGIAAAFTDLSTGGLVTAAGVGMSIVSRLLRKTIHPGVLSESGLEASARVLCERRICELETHLEEVGRQHTEALGHIRDEERELDALDEGRSGGPEGSK